MNSHRVFWGALVFVVMFPCTSFCMEDDFHKTEEHMRMVVSLQEPTSNNSRKGCQECPVVKLVKNKAFINPLKSACSDSIALFQKFSKIPKKRKILAGTGFGISGKVFLGSLFAGVLKQKKLALSLGAISVASFFGTRKSLSVYDKSREDDFIKNLKSYKEKFETFKSQLEEREEFCNECCKKIKISCTDSRHKYFILSTSNCIGTLEDAIKIKKPVTETMFKNFIGYIDEQ